MTSRDPFVLTPLNLLAAEARLFQADVDLLRGTEGTSATYWPSSPATPATDLTPDDEVDAR